VGGAGLRASARSAALLATLCVSAAGAAAFAPATRGAIGERLADVAETAQAWAQAPSGLPPDLAYARSSVASLLRSAGGDGGSAQAARALEPGLGYLGWLLSLRPTSGAQRAAVAQELDWSATDLTSESDREDGALGATASAVETVREELFRAWWLLTLGRGAAAERQAAAARRLFARALVPALGEHSAAAVALAQASASASSGEEQALAAARGRAIAAIMTSAYGLTLHAIATGEDALARRWAGVRDLGADEDPGEPPEDALRAVRELADAKLTRSAAAGVVRRDELAGLQRRTLALVQQATLAGYLGLGSSRAQAGALASGYWQLLAPIYARHLGAQAAAQASAALAQIASPTSAASPDGSGSAQAGAPSTTAARWSLQSANHTITTALAAFSAAPATDGERETQIGQLVEATRFTQARICGPVPVRANGEPAGTAAGPPVVMRLLDDLRPSLSATDAARLQQAARALATLPGASGISGEESSPKAYRPSVNLSTACGLASTEISRVFPKAWRRHDEETDFERIDAALERAQAAAAHDDWAGAESDAREGYAIFDLTPELSLLAVDPGLATRLEALFWNGGSSGRSLFDALSHHASPVFLRGLQSELEGALEQAEIVLASSHSATAVAVNSAVVVFREALEALLIVAALGAGFVTAGGRWRRPVLVGAFAAVPATALTWVLSSAALASIVGFGLQLQALLDLAALAVLLVMLAWFFQKFCWTRYAAREQARHRRILERAPRSSRILGSSLGLVAVGFTVIYREGLETVLYLQALRAQAGGAAVVEGVLLGGALAATIAMLMLRLRRRLPYRQVIVTTAALIGLLTVVMTGQATRSLQAAGWLAIAPLHVEVPVWAGQWLGLYPSLQTLLAQLGCAIAIVLTAVLSERLRTRRLARRVALARELAARRRQTPGEDATARRERGAAQPAGLSRSTARRA